MPHSSVFDTGTTKGYIVAVVKPFSAIKIIKLYSSQSIRGITVRNLRRQRREEGPVSLSQDSLSNKPAFLAHHGKMNSANAVTPSRFSFEVQPVTDHNADDNVQTDDNCHLFKMFSKKERIEEREETKGEHV